MIYFDNAATTLRKPESVAEAVTNALCHLGNSDRGSHAGALDKAELALKTLKESMPQAHYEIWPLSPAFITQGGPGCMAVQYIHE